MINKKDTKGLAILLEDELRKRRLILFVKTFFLLLLTSILFYAVRYNYINVNGNENLVLAITTVLFIGANISEFYSFKNDLKRITVSKQLINHDTRRQESLRSELNQLIKLAVKYREQYTIEKLRKLIESGNLNKAEFEIALFKEIIQERENELGLGKKY